MYTEAVILPSGGFFKCFRKSQSKHSPLWTMLFNDILINIPQNKHKSSGIKSRGYICKARVLTILKKKKIQAYCSYFVFLGFFFCGFFFPKALYISVQTPGPEIQQHPGWLSCCPGEQLLACFLPLLCLSFIFNSVNSPGQALPRTPQTHNYSSEHTQRLSPAELSQCQP